MIDIHAHILPDVTGDDGAQSLRESIEMLRVFAKTGVTDIICTPHVNRRGVVPTWSEISSKVSLLQKVAAEEQIPVCIHGGAEIELNYHALSFLPGPASRAYCLANTAYILCELTEQSEPNQTEQLLFELMLKGYIPVLAHPERYVRLMKRPERLLQWMKKGILTQCNVGSFNGEFGELAKSQAENLLRNNMIVFLGSDAHRMEWRSPDVTKGLEAIEMLQGPIPKYELNARRMIQKKYLYPSLPNTWKSYKKGFFSRLFKR